MASLCSRCAIRLRRAAEPNLSHLTPVRSFTSTSSRRKVGGIPTFTETSNPELDNVLASFRTKHFIPAALSKPERNLIFSMKTKQYLEENPQTVTIGDEDIELQWIDQRTEIPNRVKLLRKALRLMVQGEKSDWNNLPALLIGLKKAKKEPTDRQMGKIVRLATNAGHFGMIMQCLQKPLATGMTLKKEEVLNGVMWGLRSTAQGDGWSQGVTGRAIRDANEVAMHLEDSAHGTGKYVHSSDPRRRPEVLAIFLELAAVYAHKFQEGKDVDGKVKAFAERLLLNINGAQAPRTTEPAETGPQHEMLRGVSIWHGLRLAQTILRAEMPKSDLAEQVVKNWEAGLTALAKNLEAKKSTAKKQNIQPGTYDEQALTVWKDCIRD